MMIAHVTAALILGATCGALAGVSLAFPHKPKVKAATALDGDENREMCIGDLYATINLKPLLHGLFTPLWRCVCYTSHYTQSPLCYTRLFCFRNTCSYRKSHIGVALCQHCSDQCKQTKLAHWQYRFFIAAVLHILCRKALN